MVHTRASAATANASSNSDFRGCLLGVTYLLTMVAATWALSVFLTVCASRFMLLAMLVWCSGIVFMASVAIAAKESPSFMLLMALFV